MALTIRWTEAVDRPLPDGKFTCPRSVIGDVIQPSNEKTVRDVAILTMSLIYVFIAGCNRTDSKLSFSAHTKTPIPASAKLIHSGGQYAGFDASYGFVFDVADNSLQEQLVAEWELNGRSPSESGFFKFANYPWWPTDYAFLKMDENFTRSDEQNEEYWHVWHDRINGRLYIEHGGW
jgi:hypothetical protein